MNECGECTKCCEGYLAINVYGIKVQGYKCPCLSKGCTIYSIRPEVCKKFQCAWLQGLFQEDWMRPDKSGLIISIENWTKGQFFRVIETKKDIHLESHSKLSEFAHQHNTPYIIMRHNKTIELYGPEAFIQEKR